MRVITFHVVEWLRQLLADYTLEKLELHTFSIKCVTPFFIEMSLVRMRNPLTRLVPSSAMVTLIGVPAAE
jgi:hypothetical protein